MIERDDRPAGDTGVEIDDWLGWQPDTIEAELVSNVFQRLILSLPNADSQIHVYRLGKI